MQARCSTTKDEGSLKQPFMKLKVRFKLERLYPTLSIIVPAAVRWIPEAQFPYPIGFDTAGDCNILGNSTVPVERR